MSLEPFIYTKISVTPYRINRVRIHKGKWLFCDYKITVELPYLEQIYNKYNGRSESNIPNHCFLKYLHLFISNFLTSQSFSSSHQVRDTDV